MADIVDASTRSRMMACVRGKDTRQEVEIRKRLFTLGFRYRLHDTKLPGKPDIVLPKYGAVIFIHGCFWHAHDCHLFKWPSTKRAFWKNKLSGNRRRDEGHIADLRTLGWRVLVIWECSFRAAGKQKYKELESIASRTAKWLMSNRRYQEIRGRNVA